MKRLKQVLDGPAEDRGAALILVLIVVTVIGLAGAALLTFSDTSIRTTVALRDQAGNAYNADGAAQVAIENLSTGYGFTSPTLFKNANGTTCFGPNTSSGTLNLPDFYPAVSGRDGNAPSSASVVCAADPATGVNATVVPITSANRPAQGILALGQRPGEDGINIKALGSPGVFAAKGAVKSNSNINVVQGALQSSAAVTAFGGCSGSIVSTPNPLCNTATTSADPNYASEATAVPGYQAVPDDVLGSCPGGVVTFKPGYYDDASKLTDLMSGNGPCGGSTWWFKPGTYYFDFHNNTNDTDVYQGSATSGSSTADQWGIKRGHLVAGTPTDSNGNVIASPGPSPTFPGSCQSPLRSATNQGVQFIFGGDSQLALEGSADAEICGTYSATRPPIGVFGVKSGTATPTTLVGGGPGGSALKMSTVSSPQTTLFTLPTAIIEQDSVSATWVKATATSETSTIAVSGYAPPSAIPPGSIVKSASIRVQHGNSPGYVTTGPNKDNLSITFTPKGVTNPIPASPPVTLTPNLTLPIESLDLYGVGPSAGKSEFVKFVHKNGFTGADMAYAATLSHIGTESLDSMQIDISYVAPAFRGENIKMGPNPSINVNCMTKAYTGSSGGGCAVLSTLPSFSGAFYVQGTTYAPIAAIDLTLNNATQQVLRFGVISRSLWMKENGSFSYSGPVIEIPADTTGGNDSPVVYLTVFICPATTTSTCSTDAGAAKSLRVKARMSGTARRGQMSILSWSNLR